MEGNTLMTAHQKYSSRENTSGFLPMNRADMEALGWNELDVLIVNGDAYVDHPSFGAALIGRWLVHHGFRTGIIAQPAWNNHDELLRMGRPRLFAAVGAGAIDSMLAHYTAFRKKRSDDNYTPGGKAGARPNRACIVYSNLVKQAFPGLPIVLGGIEASLRRITHYDFWSDKLRRSLLLDTNADILLYGMAERGILEVARRLKENRTLKDPLIPGAAFIGDPASIPAGRKTLTVPSHEEIMSAPEKLIEATAIMESQVHHEVEYSVQNISGRSIIITPPAPLGQAELDSLYSLPFTRCAHPSYKEKIPSVEMIKFSITSHRGCAGGCSFCSLAAHQGRTIRSRSAGSIKEEAQALADDKDFKGTISDVGGPTANMWGGYCAADPSSCQRESCLFPGICTHFKVDQGEIIRMLRSVKNLSGIKHLRVASGVRHDLALKDPEYVKALVREFVGGQLKIAPENFSDSVLRLMRKPGRKTFEEFLSVFAKECEAAGKEQYVIPYLMSAFPGCTEDEMQETSEWLTERNWRPQQVQCFIPLPGTVAGAMYYAERDRKGKKIDVARSDRDRLKLHYMLPTANKKSTPQSRKRR